MRSYVASAVLAAAFIVLPATAGFAPASAQDFSITNETSAGTSWMKQLQSWWDLHAYYPPDASEANKDGNVKVHLVIQPNGDIWKVDVMQGSGWKSIDVASYMAFHGAHLKPIPANPPTPQADVYITVHFVLTHRNG
jgi:TonB family protein